MNLSFNQKMFKKISSTNQLALPCLVSVALSLVGMPTAQANGATAWVGTNTGTFLPLPQTENATGTEVSSQATVMDMLPGETRHIMVSLNLRNQEQLNAFLQALHTPGNPSYHKFLTPAQFNALYAPTQT